MHCTVISISTCILQAIQCSHLESMSEKIVMASRRKRRRRRTHHVLQRMSVNGDDSNGSGPLVVLFVVVLVEAGMVEEPEETQRIKMNSLNCCREKICTVCWDRL